MKHKNNRLKVIVRLSEAATAQFNHLKLMAKIDETTLLNAAIGCLYKITLEEINRERQRQATAAKAASPNKEGAATGDTVQPEASEQGVEAK